MSEKEPKTIAARETVVRGQQMLRDSIDMLEVFSRMCNPDQRLLMQKMIKHVADGKSAYIEDVTILEEAGWELEQEIARLGAELVRVHGALELESSAVLGYIKDMEELRKQHNASCELLREQIQSIQRDFIAVKLEGDKHVAKAEHREEMLRLRQIRIDELEKENRHLLDRNAAYAVVLSTIHFWFKKRKLRIPKKWAEILKVRTTR